MKVKNSALTTALAFHYQVLVGLDKCFILAEGESVWFERDGDVSLIGGDIENTSQIEVKNYAEPLTDHHENLWKTLKNWLAPEFNYESYGALVLHTTQAFGARTRLKDWNTQRPEQRIQVLKDICSDRTNKKPEISKPSNLGILQNAVMSFDSDVLLELIKKVTLFTEADDADLLRKNILDKFVGVPKNNRSQYLQGLVGFVYDHADKQTWTVNQKNFEAKCEELTALFRRKEFTFPAFTGEEASDSDMTKHRDKLFVQKIKDIEYHAVLSDAVGNWLELQNSLFEELDGHPSYAKETKLYQKRIIKRFKLNYSTANMESTESLKDSKILFNKTIAESPLNMGSSNPPIEYKNGLIHDAMDDEEQNLKWKVGL